ncbi:plastocyanin/azurin family copper-binding protein [Haladaptatus sp. NG-SE-30]
MFDSKIKRRRFLVLAGAATATGVTGCTTADSNANNQLSDDGATSTSTSDEKRSESGDDHTGDDDHDQEGSGHHNNDDHSHDEPVGEPVETAEVGMVSTSSGEHFEPHVVRVTKGGTVRWTNESGNHATAAYSSKNDKPQLMPDGGMSWNSAIFTEKGATFEHRFETEGVYHYYCPPHETVGMIGSIIVGNPDPHEQPALEEPPAEMSAPVRAMIEELNGICNEALGHTH